ncbi:hypothetical protein NQ315_001899 [Exocentrus adspersus]|uniref:Cyclin N-terminal domain-containing protein n=1 Tax=Exocentrus adspersus TaxID=1586481 RepID=A0AAV8W9T6_9CUCU|nr:hypothetical protein NQ315_001899 [Exocentrus adspersus]
MATFCIHEDKPNYEQHCSQHIKKFFSGIQEKKIGGSKCIENRSTFQSLNNSRKQDDAKRTKLKNEDSKECQLKNKQKKEEVEKLFLDNSFCKIDKENEIPSGMGEIENEYFPLSLLYTDEYRQDIWRYLTRSEAQAPRCNPNFILKQTDLSWNSRTILVDWLVSVADEFKLCENTFHLSVNYIDRFLSQIFVARNKFQLLGAAAMLLASKMEEYQPLDAQEWSYLTGYTFSPRQVLKMEQIILKALKFRMQPPTTYGFIQHLCSELRMDPKTVHLAMYFCDLALLEGEDYLDHLPSKLAASSVVLARHTLAKSKPWPQKLKKVSGYSLKELSPVVQRQQKTFRESPMREQKAVQTKYSSPKYNRVALVRPRALMLEYLEDED